MNSIELTNQWLNQLGSSGCRITPARKLIVEELIQSQRGVEPVDLYDQCRKHDPRLGLVTVYRTLERLEKLGLIQRVHQSDGCHMFIRKSEGHEHLLLCTSCGKAVYFEGDDLELLLKKVAKESGFTISDHWLQFFGLCPECQKGKI